MPAAAIVDEPEIDGGCALLIPEVRVALAGDRAGIALASPGLPVTGLAKPRSSVPGADAALNTWSDAAAGKATIPSVSTEANYAARAFFNLLKGSSFLCCSLSC